MNNYMIESRERTDKRKAATFIENLCLHLGYDIGQERYRKIIYNDALCTSPIELEVKSIYTAYIYLLEHQNTTFTSQLIQDFYYLIKKEPLNKEVVFRIMNCYNELDKENTLKKCVDFHFKVRWELNNESTQIVDIITSCLFNYMLLSNSILPLSIYPFHEIDYPTIVEEYQKGSIAPAYYFFEWLIDQDNSRYQRNRGDKKRIDISTLMNIVMHEKDWIRVKYKINHIYIPNEQNVEKKITVIVLFRDKLKYPEKWQCKKKFTMYLKQKFRCDFEIKEITYSLVHQTSSFLKDNDKVF